MVEEGLLEETMVAIVGGVFGDEVMGIVLAC